MPTINNYKWNIKRYCKNFVQLNTAPLLLHKSDNLQYNTLGCWVDGTNDWSTKRLQKRKKKLKRFLQRILQEIIKKNNTWNIRGLDDKSFVPATQRTSVLYWRLTDCTFSNNLRLQIYLSIHPSILQKHVMAIFPFLAASIENVVIRYEIIWSAL